MRTRGRRKSHFANSTFCWLPPESVRRPALAAWARTSKRSISSAACLALVAAAEDTGPARRRRRCGSATFSTIERRIISPSSLRDSAAARCRAGSPSRGERSAKRASVEQRSPRRCDAVGAEEQPRDLGAAAADEPGEADDLPGPHVEGDVLDDAGGARGSAPTGRTGASGGGVCLLGERQLERASEHRRRRAIATVSPARGRVRTSSPSRRTLTVSATESTSSSVWET